jgi:hypothetical protein
MVVIRGMTIAAICANNLYKSMLVYSGGVRKGPFQWFGPCTTHTERRGQGCQNRWKKRASTRRFGSNWRVDESNTHRAVALEWLISAILEVEEGGLQDGVIELP